MTCCEPTSPSIEVKGPDRGSSPHDVKIEVKSEVEVGTAGAGGDPAEKHDSAEDEKLL